MMKSDGTLTNGKIVKKVGGFAIFLFLELVLEKIFLPENNVHNASPCLWKSVENYMLYGLCI